MSVEAKTLFRERLTMEDTKISSLWTLALQSSLDTLKISTDKLGFTNYYAEYEPLTNFFRAPALTLSQKKLGHLP